MKLGLKSLFVLALTLCSAFPAESYAEMVGVGVGVNVNVQRRVIAVPHSGPCFPGCGHMPIGPMPPQGAHAGAFYGGGYVRVRARAVGGCGHRCGSARCRFNTCGRRSICHRGGGCARRFAVSISVRVRGGCRSRCRRC